MKSLMISETINELANTFAGEISTDSTQLCIYSTDASAYSERPMAVIWPKDRADLAAAVQFAAKHKIPLIPRTAGTSLAGQVVGRGIIVDISKHMTSILEVNQEEHWVRVQPG